MTQRNQFHCFPKPDLFTPLNEIRRSEYRIRYCNPRYHNVRYVDVREFLDALHVFVVLFSCNMKSTNLKLRYSPTDKINAHNVRECSLRLTKHMRARTARCSSTGSLE